MIDLILLLIPIAMIDSISPVRIAAMVTFLCGSRPYARALVYLVSIYVTYYVMGVAVAYGGQSLLEIRLPLDPTPVNFVIGLVVGLAMLIIGVMMLRRKKVETEVEVEKSKGVWGAFAAGIVITASTIPTAIPLFAAINQILKAPVSDLDSYVALVIYCLIYIAPLVALVAIRWVLGSRGEATIRKLGAGMSRWLGRLLAVLFILFGLLNVIDALGYFLFNRPLF